MYHQTTKMSSKFSARAAAFFRLLKNNEKVIDPTVPKGTTRTSVNPEDAASYGIKQFDKDYFNMLSAAYLSIDTIGSAGGFLSALYKHGFKGAVAAMAHKYNLKTPEEKMKKEETLNSIKDDVKTTKVGVKMIMDHMNLHYHQGGGKQS